MTVYVRIAREEVERMSARRIRSSNLSGDIIPRLIKAVDEGWETYTLSV